MRINPANYAAKQVSKEVNLKDLFRVIKERFIILALMTCLATLGGVIYSTYFTTPLYQSYKSLIIDSDAEYRKTLQVLIREPRVLEKVIHHLGLKTSPEALAGQISVSSIESSQVVRITVVDKDPVRAAEIANTTADVFKKEMPKIVGFNNVNDQLSDAKVYPDPINDNQKTMIVISLVFGLIAGIGMILLLDSLDDSIRTETEVELFLDLPVLGKVSKIKKRNLYKGLRRVR